MEKLPRESLLDWKFGFMVTSIFLGIAVAHICEGSFGISDNVSHAAGVFVAMMVAFPALKSREQMNRSSFIKHLVLTAVISVALFFFFSLGDHIFGIR